MPGKQEAKIELRLCESPHQVCTVHRKPLTNQVQLMEEQKQVGNVPPAQLTFCN